jgi:hypothetical protein
MKVVCTAIAKQKTLEYYGFLVLLWVQFLVMASHRYRPYCQSFKYPYYLYIHGEMSTCQFFSEGPRSRSYGRIVALRLIVQPL